MMERYTMGRYCKVCGRHRPHEKFGGRGQRAYVCKDCRKLPKDERRGILLRDEVYGFLEQSNISKKNVGRLKVIEKCGIEDVVKLAAVVREIAQARSYKKNRWRILRRDHPDIFQRAIEIGLIYSSEDWPELFGVCPFDDEEFTDESEHEFADYEVAYEWLETVDSDDSLNQHF